MLKSVSNVFLKIATSGCSKPRDDAERATWEMKKSIWYLSRFMNLLGSVLGGVFGGAKRGVPVDLKHICFSLICGEDIAALLGAIEECAEVLVDVVKQVTVPQSVSFILRAGFREELLLGRAHISIARHILLQWHRSTIIEKQLRSTDITALIRGVEFTSEIRK